MREESSEHLPEFVVNSTKNIALVSSVILFPFIIINFIAGQYLLATGISGLVALYLYAAYRCYRREYSLNVSLFGIAPVITCLSLYALYTLGISATFWSFAALFVLYFVLPIKLAALINAVFLAFAVPVALDVLQQNEVIRFVLVLIGVSVFLFMCVREIYKQHQLLVKLSVTDALTGLHNRTTLNESILHAANINDRYKTPVTLLMIDIDYFKRINDEHGHIEGDKTLKTIADLMHKNFRKPDKLFRIGGEEFLVLLHDTDAACANDIAERFRLAVENTEFIPDHKVTVSIGVYERKSEESPQAWMSMCDQQLYKAKETGRNRVVSK